MSRCFPFPPPGYEKKARTDDVDLLKKEKHREKKHKKEKKDKEKKESKDKKEKDKSDGKHRENKDKKEKRKEKKENRDKDKNRISDEKRVPGQSEGHNGEKTTDEKKLSRKPGHSGEKFIQREKEKDTTRTSVSGEKKVAGQFPGYHGEKHSQNSHLAAVSKDSKFVQELGRRCTDEGRATASQLAEMFISTDQKRDEGMVRLVAKTTESWAVEKEKNKDKRRDDRKLDGQGIRDESKSKNAMVAKLPTMVQARVEGMPKPFNKNADRQTEGKAKMGQKEVDDKRGDKNREKNKEEKIRAKDKDRDKEKKKEKVKERSEHKNTNHDKLKEGSTADHMDTPRMKTSDPLKDSEKSDVPEGNLRKRKDFETNGFLHANDTKPNKLQRPVSSFNQLAENGRILELCQTSIPSTSDRQEAANNIRLDNKERQLNGVIDAQPIYVSPAKPSLTTVPADQITGLTTKPPHPDTKYLSQVLTVPKMEEWSDFNDEEWLFQRSESQLKKPEAGSSRAEETPQVWAEALWIEPTDVYALPYVIPY